MFRLVYPSDVVLLEGILVFYHKEVRDMFDMKLFVDTDADTRLSRRVLRDIEHRGRDLEHVLHQYTTLVKPAFEEFCLPVRGCAYPAGQFFPRILATKNSRLFQSLKIRIILQVMVDSNQNERIFV